jgi:uncharacterized membrane protein
MLFVVSVVVWSTAAAAACLGLCGQDRRSQARTAWLAAAVGLGWATIALGLMLGSFWALTPSHRTRTGAQAAQLTYRAQR